MDTEITKNKKQIIIPCSGDMSIISREYEKPKLYIMIKSLMDERFVIDSNEILKTTAPYVSILLPKKCSSDNLFMNLGLLYEVTRYNNDGLSTNAIEVIITNTSNSETIPAYILFYVDGKYIPDGFMERYDKELDKFNEKERNQAAIKDKNTKEAEKMMASFR